jgi:tetratricopeptide (TPR) repeat protein
MNAMIMKSGRILRLSLMLCMSFTLTTACQQNESDAMNEAMAKLKILLQENPSNARSEFIEWLQTDQHLHVSENELDSLGYHLIKQNQIEQAVSVFQIAVELFPASWKAWDSLGEGLMYLQNESQCRQAYQRSLAINPENRNARKQLRNLDEFMLGMAGETKAMPRFSPG